MASSAAADTFAPLMYDVAVELLGEPRTSTGNGGTLRWGTHGSLKSDLDGGVWHDKEANQGGGVIDLVMREMACDKSGALNWLESKAHIPPTEARERTFYDYRDETGAVLFKVERRGSGSGSRFVQHGPDGQGGFVCREGCMRGVRRVPYRLPELLAAPADAIVFICEGEKDADRLANAGLTATTNPGGAGKFLEEYSPHFTGCRVVILEDNDQAGRDHAADVLAKLEGVAAAVAPVRLPGVPQKGDVSDWLNQGGSAHQLVEQFAKPALNNAGPELLELDDTADWEGVDVPPRRWLLDGWLPVGEAALLTGAGSVGKSLISQQLAATVAAGAPFMGVAVTQGTSIYITCEDGPEEAQRQIGRASCRERVCT